MIVKTSIAYIMYISIPSQKGSCKRLYIMCILPWQGNLLDILCVGQAVDGRRFILKEPYPMHVEFTHALFDRENENKQLITCNCRLNSIQRY